jgi:hypothetical protein
MSKKKNYLDDSDDIYKNFLFGDLTNNFADGNEL